MFKLIINHSDGSQYWQEYFNDRASCDRWLAEEKTRPYWKESFVCIIEDQSPTPEQIAAQEALIAATKQKADAAISILSRFDKTKAKDPELADALEAVSILLGAKK